MARIRSIKPEFTQSESVGRLSRDARLLFIQLWTLVDDEGRARAASRMLASLLYPYDDDAPKLIGGWLAELEQQGMIRIYDVECCRFLEVANWLKHQKIDKPSKSRLPAFAEASETPREPSRMLAPDLGPRTLDQEGIKEDTAAAVPPSNSAYAFEAGVIRLKEKDFEQWRRSFSHLDLGAELLGLSEWAAQQGQKWFFAVSAALAKKNREVGIRLEQQKSAPAFKWNGIEGVT